MCGTSRPRAAAEETPAGQFFFFCSSDTVSGDRGLTQPGLLSGVLTEDFSAVAQWKFPGSTCLSGWLFRGKVLLRNS